jgi:alcohol dehydrogenase class IV
MLKFSLVQNIKVLAGVGTAIKVGELVKEAGYKKAFLVFDSGVKAAGIIDKIIASLSASRIQYVEFDKVLPDPPDAIVNEGSKICNGEGCDCVIAIGGGSAIDTAKGITILRFNEGEILDYGKPGVQIKKSGGLISIPTTSGTGSELSDGLIISDAEHNQKVPILALNAMSEYAIIDPELTIGMPVGLTLMTGLDVFSHAAEAYTTVLSNITTDLICEKLMETVVEYLPIAIKDGANLEARTKMHVSATIGGWMLANSCAHVGHSIAHVIGANYHLVHGAACAYGFPVMIKHIAPACEVKIKKIGKILGAEFNGKESIEEIGNITAKAYITFRDEVLKLKPIKDYKLDYSNLEEIENAVVNEPFAGLCPVQVTKDKVSIMLKEALDIN